MAELSPAAQAVLDAANGASSWGPDDCLNDAPQIAAAALRAAVLQAVPQLSTGADRAPFAPILAIAAELEGGQAEPPRRHIFPTPHQIAECGGPCEQGGPEACDCGLYERSASKSTH